MTQPQEMVLVSFVASCFLGFAIFIYTYVYPKRKINLFLLLLLISILPIISIFRQGTYYSGDLTLHTVFLESFYQNLQNGILFPRWAGGLCGGYGCPVFMFEYILPFYFSALFHVLGFSFLNSMKLFLASAYILSGITMYLFIKDEYGESPAFVAAILYLFAPVRFIEMHFRVSVGEDSAFIFIPLTFMFAKKSLGGKPIYIIFGAINFLFVILAHSSIALVTIPAAFIYAYLKRTSYKELIYPVILNVLGGLLSAYYILPALFEVKYTWYIQTIYNTGIDLQPFLQYIYSPAGYGFLFQGHEGELRTIVGYVQLLIILLSVYYLVRKKYQKSDKNLLIFLLVFFFTCFLLMQSFSKFIWEDFFLLHSFIVPWRMLVPISFVTAYLGAIITRNWNKKLLIVFCLITILITILNWGNRKMTAFDSDAFQTQWSLYSEYYEPNNPIYLKRYEERLSISPQLVLHRPKAPLQILSGSGEVKEISRTQVEHTYMVHAETSLLLSENTYYFPGWKVYVNGKITNINITNRKQFGTLVFTIPKGLYYIQAEFQNTFIRFIGDLISSIALMIIIAITVFIGVKYFSAQCEYAHVKKSMRKLIKHGKKSK